MLPFFSIIIPTYNRPVLLARCLQAISRLDYPRERFEVIVVDDGSQTPPEPFVSPFYHHLDITLITQPHQGPASARNLGASRAKGEFLAFTDDDCTPASDWLKSLAKRLEKTADQMIGGRTLNTLPDNPYSTASELLLHYLYSYYNTNPDRAKFFATNNLTLPVHGFQKTMGFETLFTRAAAEDREFCERWLLQGFWMSYAPEVLVYHNHPLQFSSFLKQQFNYGCGAYLFYKLRRLRGLNHLRIEPFSFYLNMLRYPLGQKLGLRLFSILALMVLSQGANAAGFLWEIMKQITGKDREPEPISINHHHE